MKKTEKKDVIEVGEFDEEEVMEKMQSKDFEGNHLIVINEKMDKEFEKIAKNKVKIYNNNFLF